MDKYELSKDWIRKNTNKIKKAYSIALVRKYDIKLQTDVLELLKEIDPLNANEENAKVFSGILQLFTQQLKNKSSSVQKVKQKIVN